MAKRFFEDFNHALLYAKFRPTPPTSIPQTLVSFLKEKYTGEVSLAVDVGCGSGQSTTILSPHFSKVVGLDVSEAQLKQCNTNDKPSNVSYKLNGAEDLPFENNSVQLLTSCQAAHWFNLDKFFSEVHRVLVPNGVVALYGYTFPVPVYKDKGPQLQAVMDKVYTEDTGKYWSSDRILVDNRYTDDKFKIPYDSFRRDDSHYTEKVISAKDLQGYVSTWSGFQNLRKSEGDEKAKSVLDNFLTKTMDVIDSDKEPEDTSLTIKTSFFLLYGRKE